MLEFFTPEDMNVLVESAKAVMITLATVGSGLLVRFITKLHPIALNWVESIAKKNEVEVNTVALKAAMETLEHRVVASVDSVTQTFVKQMKSAKQWDLDTKSKAKSKAVQSAVESIGGETRKVLMENFDNKSSKLISHVENLVESRVNMLKYYEVKNGSNE